MRLHRVSLEAFGPFAGRVDVDLDAVSAGGLFLVHGPTGSGKTSLLDAVCFALYGDVPGARGKQGLRSDHAGHEVRPEVGLELTVAGRRLRLTRSPAWQRPKRRGRGTTSEPAVVRLEEREGTRWRVLSTRNDEVAEVVKDVLGMGLRQFASVVLLPQGEFATFLRADPDDRRALLERLFDIGLFADVEAWLAETRRSGAAAVQAAQAGLETDLLRLDDALTQVPGLLPPPDHPDASSLSGTAVEALPTRLAELDSTLQGLLTVSLTTVDAAESAESSATGALAAVRETAALLARAGAAHERLALLAADDDAQAARRGELARAEQAATLSGHLRAQQRAEQDVEAADDRVAQSRSSLRALLGADGADGPAALLVRIDALTPAADAVARESGPAREVATLLAQTVERRDILTTECDGLAAALPGLAAAHEDAERALAAVRAEAARLDSLDTTSAVVRGRLAALDEVDAGRDRVRALTPRLLAAGDARLAHQQVLLGLRRRRLDQMASELAGALVGGEPCPVCGAVEHPAPAVTTDPVTPEALATAEQALEASETAYADIERVVRDLEAAARTRLEDLADVDREGLTAELAATTAAAEQARGARSRLPAAEAACAQRRSDADGASLRHATLLATIDELDLRVDELDADADAARRRLSAAVEAHAGCPCGPGHPGDPAVHRGVVERLTVLVRAEDDLGTALERLEAVTADLTGALDDTGFGSVDEAREAQRPTPALDRLRDAVHAHDRAVDAARAVLAEPAVAAALVADEPALDVAVSAVTEARHRFVQARLRHEAVARAARVLADLRPGLESRCSDLARAAERHARVGELADLARGTGAENTLRMPLTSYVLASRLDTVAGLANERLAVMGGGRYLLEHTDERAARGARSGLGLRVLDQWTGKARETASLSGGESFMASLALALGLADAVRQESGGVDLGTLFVDEGFGSLDDDSLEQVLSVLDGLREGGRCVGVVSHVADLRARVPDQVQVHKTAAGSTVTVRARAADPAA